MLLSEIILIFLVRSISLKKVMVCIKCPVLLEPKFLSPAIDPQSVINLSYPYPPPHYITLTIEDTPLGPRALNHHLQNSEITFNTVQVLPGSISGTHIEERRG